MFNKWWGDLVWTENKMPIGRDLQNGMKQQTRSALWWHDLDWCVVARERVGSVVSVNFNPPSPRRFREKNA